MSQQDWGNTIIFRKHNVGVNSNIKPKSNKNNSSTQQCEVHEGDEDFKERDTISLDLKMRIQKARLAKGMSQKELANQINQKPCVITEYESGRVVPNNNILGNIERVLGVKLRGKYKK